MLAEQTESSGNYDRHTQPLQKIPDDVDASGYEYDSYVFHYPCATASRTGMTEAGAGKRCRSTSRGGRRALRGQFGRQRAGQRSS